MRPIRTADSNMTYTGPTSDIADLPGQIIPGEGFVSVYRFSDDDRQRIADGENLQLFLAAQPIPPVALDLTDAAEVPGPDDLRCTGCDALYTTRRGMSACGQCGAPLVRAAAL